jgi:hypothetical protein
MLGFVAVADWVSTEVFTDAREFVAVTAELESFA